MNVDTTAYIKVHIYILGSYIKQNTPLIQVKSAEFTKVLALQSGSTDF